MRSRVAPPSIQATPNTSSSLARSKLTMMVPLISLMPISCMAASCLSIFGAVEAVKAHKRLEKGGEYRQVLFVFDLVHR